MLPGLASVITAAISSPNRANTSSTAGMLLYGNTIVSAAAAPVTPGEDGRPSVATPEPGVGQQRVAVAVVAAGELDDLGAAGVPAGQPDRAHGGLGAGVDQPQPVDRGHPADDLGGQLGLGRGGGAEGQTVRRGPLHGLDDGGVGVAEDHRAPGAHQVDVAVAVGVGQPVALGGGDEPRGAAHRGERPHRRVHPAGDDGARLGEEPRGGFRAGCRLVCTAHGHQCSSRATCVNYRV